jgi:predicted ATPase
MLDLDIQPEIVGRDWELVELKKHLEKAKLNQGSAVFIPGEAGVGKTRLVNEIKDIARTEGFQVLSGNSMYESLAPYSPFIEALRSGGLEHLFGEEAPRIEVIYLMTHGGLLIKNVKRHDSNLSPDIFASMLTGVSNFVNETLSKLSGNEKEGTLNSMGYENYRILIETGKNANLVVILTGKENEFLINDMKIILQKTNKAFGGVLKEWDGDEKRIKGIEEILQPLILSGKYNGIYYGKEDPKARRNLLFENVSMGLIRQSQRTPTLLCIEDLHWADPSTLALMHYVSRNTRESGLLILGTYRPEELAIEDGKGHPLVNVMQLMNREDLKEKIELERLPRENIEKLLRSLLGKINFSEEFISRIYKETEGNPLFVIQLVKYLDEGNIILTKNCVWNLTKNLDEINIPSKVYNVIEQRLDRVEKKYRTVLDYACVIGETFSSNTLASALKLERVTVLEQLRKIEHKHKLVHPVNGNHKFDHGKIKEVLYQEIPKDLKLSYHLRVANSIEEQNKESLDEVVGDLAFHYYNCRNKKKALTYILRAAEKAEGEYSNEEAIGFYNQALEFEEDNHKRLEILIRLGEINISIGVYNKSIEIYNKALELTSEKKKKAEILTKIGQVYTLKDEYEKAVEFCQKALDFLGGLECKEEAFSLYLIGQVYIRKGNYYESLKYLKKSSEKSTKIHDQMGLANTLKSISGVYSFIGDWDKAFECLHNCLSIYYKINDLKGIGHSLNSMAVLLRFRGEIQKSLEQSKKSLEIKEKIGDRHGKSFSYLTIANNYRDLREYHRALEYYNLSLRILKNIGDQLHIAICLHNIGDVYRYKGDYKKALNYYNRSFEIEQKIDIQRPMTYTYCGIAETYLKKDNSQKALEYAKLAFDLSTKIGYKSNIGSALKIYGMIYRKQMNWAKAVESFEKSIDITKEIKRDLNLGKIYHEFGLMWKDKGDVEKAKEYMGNAIEVYKNINLEKFEEEVSYELNKLHN